MGSRRLPGKDLPRAGSILRARPGDQAQLGRRNRMESGALAELEVILVLPSRKLLTEGRQRGEI